MKSQLNFYYSNFDFQVVQKDRLVIKRKFKQLHQYQQNKNHINTLNITKRTHTLLWKIQFLAHDRHKVWRAKSVNGLPAPL